MFSRSEETAPGEDAPTCKHAALEEVVLQPSSPIPISSKCSGKEKEELKQNTGTLFCTKHTQNRLIIFKSYF